GCRLGHAVSALRPERRLFIRRACSGIAKAFGRTGIVKTHSASEAPQRLEHIERTEDYARQCLCRLRKGQRDRGLAREVVNLIWCDSLDHLGHRLKVGRRHRMKRYLVADAEGDETIETGEGCIAPGLENDVALPEKEAREISAVLAGYACDEGHLVRRSGHRSTVRYMAVYSPLGIGRISTLSSKAVELAAQALDHAIPIAQR